MSTRSPLQSLWYLEPAASSGWGSVGRHQRCEMNTMISSSACGLVTPSELRGKCPSCIHSAYGTTTIGASCFSAISFCARSPKSSWRID
eukprot:3123959-Prymnesium_polylepis.2